ncbi:WhiB family transcriptional regulator [Spirillospora sp. NPDC048823]|uniref:WhiB family transcriptional regulator n=1 Tax=unclassified Spirillospora TaxID=2642701 RepID=UPI00371D39EF
MPALRHCQRRGHSPWDGPGRVDLRLEVPAWTKDALCAQIGVEVFFSDPTDRHTLAQAKRICRACPVQDQCLEWALSFSLRNDQYGVFGGAGPGQRRALRRERERQQT